MSGRAHYIVLTVFFVYGLSPRPATAQERQGGGLEISASAGWFVPGASFASDQFGEVEMQSAPATGGHVLFQFRKIGIALRGLRVSEIELRDSDGFFLGTARLEAVSVALGYPPGQGWPRWPVRPIMWLALGALRLMPVDTNVALDTPLFPDYEFVVDAALGIDIRMTENLRLSIEGRALWVPKPENQSRTLTTAETALEGRVDFTAMGGLVLLIP